MKYWYNRFHRDAGYGYRLCHKGDFWSPALCDAVERAVTGAFQHTRIEIRLGQTVQQSGWVTAGGRRYYMICNIVKEADKESGARNIYTADFFLVELEKKEEPLFFSNYRYIFTPFYDLARNGKEYEQKKDPSVFLPQEPAPFDQDSLPLGLVKKFVPDIGLNDRLIDVISWWSARKNRVLALNFNGFDGVLETVRNLYHMLPLYARKRFGFTTYTPDPQERLRCAPGCSILCVQQKDKDQMGEINPLPGSGEIDFCGGTYTSGKIEDRYYTHIFRKLVKTDGMDQFNRFLLQNQDALFPLLESEDILAKEALFALYAVEQPVPYLQPDLGERQQITGYLRKQGDSPYRGGW